MKGNENVRDGLRKVPLNCSFFVSNRNLFIFYFVIVNLVML